MAKKEISVKVDHVSMKFNLSAEKVDDLKDFVIKKITGKLSYQEYWALNDVNFKLEKGDRLGILGLNGAGKSTLLKVISGVMKPTKGSVTTKGKIVPLLELGAGFDSQYTGRENIYLYGAMLGYTKEFIEEKYDEIVEFSELGDFIDVPVKNYSSGMKARLGFSIATVVEPDILILDEVLSVGDSKFRRKSLRKVESMFENSDVTVLFVSHSIEQVRRICNKAILLEYGTVKEFGNIGPVSKIYEEMTADDATLLRRQIWKDERKRAKRRTRRKSRRAYREQLLAQGLTEEQVEQEMISFKEQQRKNNKQ